MRYEKEIKSIFGSNLDDWLKSIGKTIEEVDLTLTIGVKYGFSVERQLTALYDSFLYDELKEINK